MEEKTIQSERKHYNEDIIPRDSLAMRLTLDPRNFDANEKKKLKQKLNILKEAILQERAQNKDLNTELQEIKQKYEKVILEIDQKDQDIIKKQNEIQKLREILILERNEKQKYKNQVQSSDNADNNNRSSGQRDESSFKSNNSNTIMSNVGSLFGFGGQQNGYVKEDDFKDLLDKYQKCSFDIDQAQEKIRDLEHTNMQTMQSYEEKIKTLKLNIEKQESQYMELNKVKREQNKVMEALEISKQNLEKDFKIAKENILKLTQELKQKDDKIFDLQNQNLDFERMQKENQMHSEDIINDLNKSNMVIEKQKIEIEKLNKQIRSKQNNQVSSNSNILFYQLTKLNGLATIPAQLMFRVNLDGDYMMEIHTFSGSSFIPCQYIMNVEVFQNPPTLTITHRSTNEQKKIHNFQSNTDLVEIAKKIREFTFNAPSLKKKYDLDEKQGNSSSGGGGGLLNGMFSMFKTNAN